MKKLMLLAAMLAMVVLAAAPASAQVVFEAFGQEAESGEVEQEFSVESTGDNSNQCVGFQGVGNTGSNQNAQGAIQFDEFGFFDFFNFFNEIEIEDSGEFAISPESEVECTQSVEQASAASSN